MQLAPVHHLLQLEERRCFMPADIANIVRTGAAKRKVFRIFKSLNIHFIVGGVAIIFYAEHSRAKKIIIFNQLNEAKRMNFLSATDHFIGSMGIYMFEKVW